MSKQENLREEVKRLKKALEEIPQSVNPQISRYINLGWVAKILSNIPESGLRPEEKEFLSAWGSDNYSLERGRCRTLVTKLSYYRLVGFERRNVGRN